MSQGRGRALLGARDDRVRESPASPRRVLLALHGPRLLAGTLREVLLAAGRDGVPGPCEERHLRLLQGVPRGRPPGRGRLLGPSSLHPLRVVDGRGTNGAGCPNRTRVV